MGQVTLATEMVRLLARPPFGGLSALARVIGISSASVSGWKQGHSTPTEEKWEIIEQALGLPDGHLRRAFNGQFDKSVHPMRWPVGDNRTPSSTELTTNYDQLLENIFIRLERLEADVERLSRPSSEAAANIVAQAAKQASQFALAAEGARSDRPPPKSSGRKVNRPQPHTEPA